MAASEYELCLQVGEQIRQRRVQLKMNQSELAERADVARNTVYRIEAGQPGCKMGYLLRVLQALGVSANDLFCAPIQEQELAPPVAAAKDSVLYNRQNDGRNNAAYADGARDDQYMNHYF